VEKNGRQAAIDRLLALEKAGKAGKKEYGMLFSLLEKSTEAPGADVSTMLAGFMKNLDSSDTAQLRRMARMYARLGEGRRASILYQWCAIREGGRNYYGAASDLLNDVIDNLKGTHRDEAVSAILASSEPEPTYFFGMDGYENLVLTTWVRLLGPEAALERARPICENIANTGQMPRRRAAATAAWLLARAGEQDRALACLEVALCKLDAPAGLEHPHYVTYFTSGGRISDPDLQKLFPKGFEGWKEPSGWLEQALGKVRAWHEADRVTDYYAFRLLSVLAMRLHEVGNEQAAGTAFEQAQELAQSGVSQLLWVIDIARLIGRTDYADATELQLLNEGRLHIERVPEVVSRIKKTEGPEAALALGEKAAEYTLHPDLLDLLASCAEEAGKPDRAQHWKTVKQAAEKAIVALEEEKN
jgi:tetratricopeptide (TPR) repeat protein